MITVEKAYRLIRANIPPLKAERVRAQDALGCVLAEDVSAPFPLPGSDNSAMDGFVLRSKDARRARPIRPVYLKISGTVRAGDGFAKHLSKGQAQRIMTGAWIPRGGDTVLKKEEAVVRNGSLFIDRAIRPGKHVRKMGEEVARGRRVLKRYSVIHAGTAGILATLGKVNITVFKRPRVALIATGSELIQPGRPLIKGRLYDSNTPMIRAALCRMGIAPVSQNTVKDEPHALREAVRAGLKNSDCLILMGGVSVGDYDFVKEVLRGLGVRTVFWRVGQKPGKPLYFGKRGRTLVFGLPGNPASVYTCFYEYVYPALRKMSGFRNAALCRARAILARTVRPDKKRFLFLKGKVKQNGGGLVADPLSRQGSHMISSLAEMTGFIRIPPGTEAVKSGSQVEVDLLPGGES